MSLFFKYLAWVHEVPKHFLIEIQFILAFISTSVCLEYVEQTEEIWLFYSILTLQNLVNSTIYKPDEKKCLKLSSSKMGYKSVVDIFVNIQNKHIQLYNNI